MTQIQSEQIRVNSETTRNLRQYCINKYGKIHGRLGREAAIAINKHIKGEFNETI